MRGNGAYLAQSLDNERRTRRGFGKGQGGPAPKPKRLGVDPTAKFSGGATDAEDYDGDTGGEAPMPNRPGVSPAPRQPTDRRGGDKATGANRGRKNPRTAQKPNSKAELGMPEPPPSKYSGQRVLGTRARYR